MSRVTYLVNKSFIVVHREHGVPPVRWRAGCPLTPLVFAAMLRQEAKAQGLSPTLTSERVVVDFYVSKKKKRTKTKSVQPSPLLSCTPQPFFPCRYMATASLRTPREHNMKNKSRGARRSSDSASVSASNGFHPGQHQMFLTNVHPPIPQRD